MKKQKIAAVGLAAVMATMVISGCGSSSSSASQSTGSSTASGSSSETASASSESTGSSVSSSSISSGSESSITVSADQLGTGYEPKNDYSISVILKTTASEYSGYLVAGAEKYEEDHPGIQVDVKGATSETAFDEQQNMIETDLNSGAYDGYVMAPLQTSMVKTLISGCTKPIVAVDADIDAPEVISFVGLSQYDAAVAGGKAAVQKAKELGWDEVKAISIAGIQGDEACTDRVNGYKDGVEAEGGDFLEDEVQYADAVADKAVTCMEGIMQSHPEGIACIVCHNDDIAVAAAKAASGNEAYQNTVFCGFDAIKSGCQSIIDGKETMSVGYSCYNMAYTAVETVVRALDGETVPSNIGVEPTIVDSSNAQERYDELNEISTE